MAHGWWNSNNTQRKSNTYSPDFCSLHNLDTVIQLLVYYLLVAKAFRNNIAKPFESVNSTLPLGMSTLFALSLISYSFTFLGVGCLLISTSAKCNYNWINNAVQNIYCETIFLVLLFFCCKKLVVLLFILYNPKNHIPVSCQVWNYMLDNN